MNFVKRTKSKKLIGSHPAFSKFKFPRNDKVVSKGKTPKDKGARGCIHCGSLNHWDKDHVFADNEKRAKVFFTKLDSDAIQAYMEYEQCCASDEDDSSSSASEAPNEITELLDSSDEEDFPKTLA